MIFIKIILITMMGSLVLHLLFTDLLKNSHINHDKILNNYVLPVLLFLGFYYNAYILMPLFVVLILARKGLKGYKERKQREVFTINSYKIYRYFNLQLYAGVGYEKALSNLHEVIEDERLKEVFRTYGVAYGKFHDQDMISKVLESTMGGEYYNRLIRNLLEGREKSYGENGLGFQEEYMQTRYFSLLKQRLHKKQLLMMISGWIILASILFHVLYPLIATLGETAKYLY